MCELVDGVTKNFVDEAVDGSTHQRHCKLVDNIMNGSVLGLAVRLILGEAHFCF